MTDGIFNLVIPMLRFHTREIQCVYVGVCEYKLHVFDSVDTTTPYLVTWVLIFWNQTLNINRE